MWALIQLVHEDGFFFFFFWNAQDLNHLNSKGFTSYNIFNKTSIKLIKFTCGEWLEKMGWQTNQVKWPRPHFKNWPYIQTPFPEQTQMVSLLTLVNNQDLTFLPLLLDFSVKNIYFLMKEAHTVFTVENGSYLFTWWTLKWL